MIPDEGQTVERKESLSLWRNIVETCAAFATAHGGKVYIGVRDNGVPIGVQIGRGTLEDLANKISQNTSPKLVTVITTTEVAGKTVVVVDVAESATKPVYAFEKPLRRSGRTNQVLSPTEAAEMYWHGRGRTWDYTLLTEAGSDDVSLEKVEHFLERARAARRLEIKPTVPVEQVLRQLKLVRDGKPAVAGVLLFGRSPTQLLPQATVRCARFKGETEMTFVDMQIIEGTVIEQVDRVMEFAQRNLAMAARIEGALERRETWEYPLEALREAVINAVCHRDYSSAASVQLRIFDDRLEVWNPGGLPPELSVKDLRVSHASIPRNKLVADAFFLMGFVEQFGTGTRRMIERLRQAGLPEPEFESQEHFFRVTFRKEERTEEKYAGLGLNDRQLLALRQASQKGRMTRQEYVEATGCTDRTAKRDLVEMVEKKILVKHGKTKGSWYELSRG